MEGFCKPRYHVIAWHIFAIRVRVLISTKCFLAERTCGFGLLGVVAPRSPSEAINNDNCDIWECSAMTVSPATSLLDSSDLYTEVEVERI